MIRVLASFHLTPGNFDKAMEIAKELVVATRQEEGCIQYDFAQSTKDENQLVIIEDWESQAALDDHGKLPHFVNLIPKLSALCTEPPAIDTFVQII